MSVTSTPPAGSRVEAATQALEAWRAAIAARQAAATDAAVEAVAGDVDRADISGSARTYAAARYGDAPPASAVDAAYPADAEAYAAARLAVGAEPADSIPTTDRFSDRTAALPDGKPLSAAPLFTQGATPGASREPYVSRSKAEADGTAMTDADWAEQVKKAWGGDTLARLFSRAADGQSVLGCATTKQKEASERLRAVLKQAGVNLLPNERLSITLDKDGAVAVDGLNSDVKKRRVEKLLGDDPELAALLRQAQRYGRAAAGMKTSIRNGQVATETKLDDATRHALVDAYLREQFGQRLGDLALRADGGGYALDGANAGLLAALEGDAAFETAVHAALHVQPAEGYAAAEPFTVEFSNGMVVDPAVRARTMETIEDLHQSLIAGMSSYNTAVEKAWREFPPAGVDAQTLEDLIASSKFDLSSIEIVFNENGWSYSGRVGVRHDIPGGLPPAKQALESWLGDLAETGLVSDIFEQMLVCHQAEYGDADNEEHTAEMRLTAGAVDAYVSSPAADAATMAAVGALADALGSGLAEALRDRGVADPLFDLKLTDDGRLVAAGGMAGAGGAPLAALVGGANLLGLLRDRAGSAADPGPKGEADGDGPAREIGLAAARRENGFMQSAADARRADERREARQENYREQDRKVDDHGAVMPRWVGASPEKATGTGGHPMPAVNGVDTITVSASALEVERRRGRRSAGGSEGGVTAGRAVGGLPPATAADGMDERRRLDTGLAEFSRPDPALAIRTRECVQRLRLGRPDANLIREATDLLGAWMDRLHDPRLIEQLTVTVA